MASTDARPVPRKNAPYRATFPILDADGDLVTGAAGLDSETSGDGGTFTDCTNEATEIATSSGMYYLDLTAAEMNYDTVSVIVKTSTSGAKTTVLVLYTQSWGLGESPIRTYVLQKGATSKTVYFKAFDADTRLPKTGLVYNTSGLTASYYRAKASAGTAITLATQTANGGYSSGGFVEVDSAKHPGLYRLDLPDAAIASGVDEVLVLPLLTGVNFEQVQIALTDYDPNVAGASVGDIFAGVVGTAMTEAYSTKGGTVTLAQGIYELLARQQEIVIVGTTMTVKKRDGTTTAYTLTLNDSAAPTGATRGT